MTIEYWVARVVGPATPEAVAVAEVAARIASGALFVSGDEICEPLDMVESQEKAENLALRHAARYGFTCKVVLSADL